MKNKIKFHQGSESGDWSREDSAAIRYWNRILLLLGIVIAIASIVSLRAPQLELGSPLPEGFVLWFMLCMAYPVLGLLGLINMLFGTQDSTIMRFFTHDHQILTLVVIDLLTTLVIWALGRYWALRKLGAVKLRIGGNFLLILGGWGIFQLLLFGISSVWQGGGFQPLHGHLKQEEPEKVILVEKDTVPPTAPVKSK